MNLGVHARPNLVVLRKTKMPAVLVEVGFINSETDNILFDNNFQDIALAIAEGILDTIYMEEEESEPEYYRVQTGAFRNRRYAERLLDELLEQEYPAFIDDTGPYYRVQVGEYDNLNEAAQMERRLKRAGYQTVLVR